MGAFELNSRKNEEAFELGSRRDEEAEAVEAVLSESSQRRLREECIIAFKVYDSCRQQRCKNYTISFHWITVLYTKAFLTFTEVCMINASMYRKFRSFFYLTA